MKKAERKQRSMSEALASPEALRFLNEGNPARENRAELNTVKIDLAPTPHASQRDSEIGKSLVEPLVSVTVRLPAWIANALIDVSAERRKARVKKRSQQDIVTEVLAKWLKKEGFQQQ